MADTKKAQLSAGVNGDGKPIALDFFAMVLREELASAESAAEEPATVPVPAGDLRVAATLLRELSAVYADRDIATLADELAARLAGSAGDPADYRPGQITA